MDTSAVKRYAPQARKDFIAAITDRAGYYGLGKKQQQPMDIQGEVALIGGRPHPKAIAPKRQKLEARIAEEGFDVVMESIAYTWFNRFVAIRYMELHGYLEHGCRVLSHPDGAILPEIMERAEDVDLPGLHRDEVIKLKLAGDQDNALYRKLLIAQCNALHNAMEFLFESIDDETELLLPDNLLHSGSIIRKLVDGVPEADWRHIEVIGWIYQFYIAERKDQVIGKVVKSEDIPAATQLFTPSWIVQYLVQNALGRTWLAAYPNAPLKGRMAYYIDDGDQPPEVQAALRQQRPERLDPEAITLLDPAAGSGHILVEAYDCFKAIYQERGYRSRDIPRKILQNNLFGLEIDPRAAQLAAFALIMKARPDDPRLLKGGIRMHIHCLSPSDGLRPEEVYDALTGIDMIDRSGLPPATEFDFAEEEKNPLFAHVRQEQTRSVQGYTPNNQDDAPGFSLSDIRQLLACFPQEDVKTYGSLIRIPKSLVSKLPEMVKRTDFVRHGDDLSRQNVAERFTPIVEQAWLLSKQYDVVVANPPYMGSKGMNPKLKKFMNQEYPEGKSDLFAAFMLRNIDFALPHAYVAMITMQSWMFLSSYEKLRNTLLSESTLITMAHLGARAFDSIGGEVVSTTAFVLENKHMPHYKGAYIRLVDFDSEATKSAVLREVAQQ